MSEKAKKYPFWLKTGEGLYSIDDLLAALGRMSRDTYNHHVTLRNNDFSNWISDILEDPDLAEAIRHARSAAECLRLLRSALPPMTRPYNKWTKEDIKKLKRLFPSRTNLDIARIMNRSLVSISSMAFKLDLKKKPEFKAQLGRISMSKRWGVPVKPAKCRRCKASREE